MARNAATPEMTLKVNYDLNTLNNESAARLASQVADETERDNLLNSYIGHVKKKSAPNYMENAPTYKEMRAKTNSMSKYGVYEADKAEIAKSAERPGRPKMRWRACGCTTGTATSSTRTRPIRPRLCWDCA